DDKHTVDVGTHARQGDTPNALEVPALGSAKGGSAAAMSGNLNLWCPSGRLTIQATSVDATPSDAADGKGGTKQALQGPGSATMSATVSGKYQGGTIKLGAG